MPTALPFVRSIFQAQGLRFDETTLVEETLGRRLRRLQPGETLVKRGEMQTSAYLVLEGWAYRSKFVSKNRRQIIGFLIAGDLSDFILSPQHRSDHTITSLTDVTVAELSAEVFDLFIRNHARIAHALWAKTQRAASIQREWAVNLGQRTAPERIGHFLCEMFHRLRAVGLVDGTRCLLPLTQVDLAETTGLSLVHVNKRLKGLRNAGLIVLRGKTLVIPDLAALEAASLFDADYLDLPKPAVPPAIATFDRASSVAASLGTAAE